MKSLSDRLRALSTLLAPYAVPLEGTLGRETTEPDDETRFPFQRDRDRIIHTQAFRRLQGKTQVFVAGEGDHYRTRLTHTMEVAQLSRDMARTLSLNEDLAEAIALAHDLGHPPFGHRGEQTLDTWMREQGKHFEHNEHSLRIVTLLEEHSSLHAGLNLNREVTEGLRKHEWDAGDRMIKMSLEAQLVNRADEISYTAHDIEDGLRAGLFSLSDLGDSGLIKEAASHAKGRGTSLRGALIHLLVADLYRETEKRLQTMSIRTLDGLYASTEPISAFSEASEKAVRSLRARLHQSMYSHPRITDASEEGQEIIRTLCERFLKNPPQKVLDLQKRTGSTLVEAVKDYVAGMTDNFAGEFIGKE